MIKKVIFISGLGGTGKSTMVYHFLENPIYSFTFFDFDKGKLKAPPYNESHLEWRKQQTKWWLRVANKEFDIKNNITVIIGLCLYPRQIIELPEAKFFGKDNIHFAHLISEHSDRKDRLYNRGDSHHCQGHKPWYDEFFEEMSAVKSFEINTSSLNINDTAKTIQDWLVTIKK
jgi:deoxyadenosine/deoxycytidine kinase